MYLPVVPPAASLLFRAVLWAVAVCMFGLTAPPVQAQEHQISVLSFGSTRTDAPAALVWDEVMQRVLAGGRPQQLDYYAEHLDLARFPDATYRQATQAYLRAKYAGFRFDAIVVLADAALDFASHYRDEAFPDTPIIFVSSRAPAAVPGDATGLLYGLHFEPTVALAARLRPRTRRVFVVSGVSEFDEFYEAAARREFEAYRGQLSFEYLSGLPMPDLLRRVATLPPDSAILFLTLTEDGLGDRFIGAGPLDELTAAANAPTYAWHWAGMGRGIIGGHLISQELLTTRAAELVLRVVGGTPADTIPVAPVDVYVNAFDWRQLRRWNIAESSLPVGSVVLHREATAWEQYRTYVVGGVSLLVLQAALITALLIQRAHRRRTEAFLRESQRDLEVRTNEARGLAGQLIVAQEDERARIARELHDDISQQVAGLSITLSMLKRRLQTSEGQAEVPSALGAIQQRTIELAESVRALSRGLHPSALRGVDIASSLRAHCHEVSEQCDADVSFDAQGDFGAVSPEAKLCLYRVTQEGLRNAVAHASARHVDVRLTRTPDGADLTIVDDGRGFDVESPNRRAGLGLKSIRERVRLTGGMVSIQSGEDLGTTLKVHVPIRTH